MDRLAYFDTIADAIDRMLESPVDLVGIHKHVKSLRARCKPSQDKVARVCDGDGVPAPSKVAEKLIFRDHFSCLRELV